MYCLSAGPTVPSRFISEEHMRLRIGERYIISQAPSVRYVEITSLNSSSLLFSGTVVFQDGQRIELHEKWGLDGSAIYYALDSLDGLYVENDPLMSAGIQWIKSSRNCFFEGHELPDAGGLAFNYCKHCDTKFLWNRSMWMWEEANKQPRAS